MRLAIAAPRNPATSCAAAMAAMPNASVMAYALIGGADGYTSSGT